MDLVTRALVVRECKQRSRIRFSDYRDSSDYAARESAGGDGDIFDAQRRWDDQRLRLPKPQRRRVRATDLSWSPNDYVGYAGSRTRAVGRVAGKRPRPGRQLTSLTRRRVADKIRRGTEAYDARRDSNWD